MSYPNVLEKFNEYLPLSGGTMSGTIKKNGFLAQNIVDDNLLVIRGGTDATSAFLGLCGKNHSNKGMAYLCASNGTTTTNFCVLPEGYATLAGSKVITSAGGTITGNLIVSSIQFSNKGLLQSSNDEQYKSFTITSENTWSNEVPFIVMRKIDATNSDKGTVYINAGNGTTYSRITLNADSSLNHDGRPIVSVTKWTSGTSGYRKYADGLIEQWGRSTTSGNAVITLPLAFSNTNYNLTVGGGNSGGVWAYGNIISTTQIQVGLRGTNSFTQPTHWFACGY